MRFLMFFTIFFATYNTALAETLPGSDQQSYSRNVKLVSDTHSGDRYATVVGRVLIDGKIAAPVVLFSDIPNLPDWIDNLSQVQEVEARTPIDRSLYMRFAAPVGFEDRDGYIRFMASMAGPEIIHLTLEDIPNDQRNSDTVRMKDVRGRFRVEQVLEDLLAVEFRLHYDSGARPVTLANLSVKRQVKQTLIQMRQHIEGPLRDAQVDSAITQSLGL